MAKRISLTTPQGTKEERILAASAACSHESAKHHSITMAAKYRRKIWHVDFCKLTDRRKTYQKNEKKKKKKRKKKQWKTERNIGGEMVARNRKKGSKAKKKKKAYRQYQ